jgi:hypothetical protein
MKTKFLSEMFVRDASDGGGKGMDEVKSLLIKESKLEK